MFAEDAVPLLLPMLGFETDDEVVRWLISACVTTSAVYRRFRRISLSLPTVD